MHWMQKTFLTKKPPWWDTKYPLDLVTFCFRALDKCIQSWKEMSIFRDISRKVSQTRQKVSFNFFYTGTDYDHEHNFRFILEAAK